MTPAVALAVTVALYSLWPFSSLGMTVCVTVCVLAGSVPSFHDCILLPGVSSSFPANVDLVMLRLGPTQRTLFKLKDKTFYIC